VCFGWLRGGGSTRGLLVVRVELLCHDEPVVTGNPQAVLFTGVQYDDFLLSVFSGRFALRAEKTQP